MHLSSAAQGFAAKLAKKFDGPFKLVAKTKSPLVWKLEDTRTGKDVGTALIERLKLAVLRQVDMDE